VDFNAKGIIISIVAIVLLIVGLSLTGRIFENIPADKIVVIQDPVDGELHIYTTPGLVYQNFGKATHYPKSFQFWFSALEDQGDETDQSIPMRFNDAGRAKVSGSARCELPLSNNYIIQIHMMYGSEDAVKSELVRPAFQNAVYMTGPLMTLMESTGPKRSLVKTYIEDQVQNGIYKTTSEEIRIVDKVSKIEKTVTMVKIIKDENGNPVRKDLSTLCKFGIKVYNLSLNKIGYDPEVEAQIANQQKAIMEVQIAMAEAKKARQRAITEEQEGKARAAKARWQQEEKKAKKVVIAQEALEISKLTKDRNIVVANERLEVATLDNETAEQRKQENIKIGQGQAARKKAVMEADGALEQKLRAYTEIMVAFAENLPRQKWVPEMVINSGSGEDGLQTGSSMEQIIQLLGVKAARDLSLDMSIKTGSDD